MTDDDLPDGLVREYRPAVSQWLRNQGIADTENLVGDVFRTAVELWRRMPRDAKVPPDKWGGWLWTITQYKLANAVRKSQVDRTRTRVLQANLLPHQSAVGDPADEVASRLDLQQSWRLLDAVDEPDRSILRLLWEDRSAQEIADELGLKRGQVAMRIVRINQYFQRRPASHPRPRKALDDLRKSFETGGS